MEKEVFIQQIIPLRKKLLRYASQFLKEEFEAEDVVQEVFIKLWCMREKLHKYENKTALSYTITKNLCLNRLKSKQYNELGLEGVIAQSNATMPHHELEEKEDAALTMQIIDSLPDTQRAILKMRHVEGLEIQEIAQLTGSKEEAVRVNLSRGRKRVKELFFKLEKYGTEK